MHDYNSSRMKRIVIPICFFALFVGFLVGFIAVGITVFRVVDHEFQTGKIEIDLNGGKAVFSEDEFLLEPGATIEKEFYVQNNSTWSVYYKLYFSDVSGSLSDVLIASILDEEQEVLFSDEISQWTKERTLPLEEALEVDQRRNLTLRLHFPREAGNEGQGEALSFQLSVIAVQTKNNPDKEFE